MSNETEDATYGGWPEGSAQAEAYTYLNKEDALSTLRRSMCERVESTRGYEGGGISWYDAAFLVRDIEDMIEAKMEASKK